MKYLIFDFDGVLADSFEAVVYANQRLRNQTREEALAWMNVFFAKSIHSRDMNLTEDQINAHAKLARQCGEYMMEHGLRLFDDFVSEIAKIADTKLAVVSSGSNVYITSMLEKVPLHFTHILTFEDHHSKEHKVEQICRDWGISVRDAYFFTDTRSDVVELKGLLDSEKLYGCAWGFQGHDVLREVLDESHILKQFADIHTIFDR